MSFGMEPSPAGIRGGLVDDGSPRACTSCGAENPTTAQFCWRCYATFADMGRGFGPLPPPPGRLGWPPATTSVQAPPVSAGGRLVALLVGALVAVGLLVGGFWWFGRSDVAMPGSFGGLMEYSTPQTDSIIEQFRRYAGDQGVEADMALYAQGGVPRAALMWVRDPTDGGFDALSSGMVPGLGAAGMSVGELDTQEVGGLSYRCAQVGQGSLAGALCMWKDEDVIWFLFDMGPGADMGETRNLAVQAHSAS